MSRPKKIDKARDKALNAMLDAAVKYLRATGWTASVIGPTRIQHWPGDLALKHEIVIELLGFKSEARKVVTK